MPVTRHDYEHWFLLYVDNELTPAERAEVEAFAEANPDLAEELQLLLGSRLQVENVSFPGKELLLKQSLPDAVSEEQLLLLLDQELSPAETESITARIQASPEITAAWELLQQTKLQPEAGVLFPDKQSLYRKESMRVVPLRWWQLAAAAMLIGAGLWGTVQWMNREQLDSRWQMADGRKKTGNDEQGMTNREQKSSNEIVSSGQPSTTNRQQKDGGNATQNREQGMMNEVASSGQPSTVNRQQKDGGWQVTDGRKQTGNDEQGMMNREQKSSNEIVSSGQPSTINRQQKDGGVQMADGGNATQNREQGMVNEVASSRQPSTVNHQLAEQGMTNREQGMTNEVASSRQPSTINPQPAEQGMVNREQGMTNEVASSGQPSTVNRQLSSGGSSDVVYASFDEDDDEDRPRKSKVGAFFRRAKRVFERKTKIKTGNSEDVRIANMTFAMH